MSAPVATYRLQFRNGMTFARAAEIVPYLQWLGVSHLYASPIFAATSGSTHGYDVIDHNSLDPALGGAAGFERLAKALRRAGLGLVLDIVPNHMAAHPQNSWWRSVLEWGEASAFARYFDIDWSERLTLPVLGAPFESSLAAGTISFRLDAAGYLGLAAGETVMPITPASYGEVLARLDHPAASALATLAAAATPGGDDALHAAIRALFAGDAAAALQQALEQSSGDHALVRTVHAAQAWQLTPWREARRHLSYRRFFEVTGLAGVRVEDAAVFDDVHRLTLRLLADDTVDGLRVDHVDGLANPRQYLERLRQAAGAETWIVVEKILEADENLPPEWPVAGTTGYEFIAALAGVLVDAARATELDAAYAAAVAPATDFATERRHAKLEILCRNLETELSGLVQLAEQVAAAEAATVPGEDLRRAIVELIVALPVYRFYGQDDGLPEADRRLLQSVVQAARRDAPDLAPEALDFVARLLLQQVGPGAAALARRFRRRLQQTSGPVMAKAIEDTLFYRRNRLLALNEVGGDPQNRDGSVVDFHARMEARVTAQPEGLLATATHDTKRGEDARARLYALSEAPAVWADSVARWRALQQPYLRPTAAGPAPDPEMEWLIYQALAGAWPLRFDADDEAALEQLRRRFSAYLEKAMREAKRGTSWSDVDAEYEAAVQRYAAHLLAPPNRAFRKDFDDTLQPFCRAGALNSLSQTVLKLTTPGVPDIYQGSEGWDFSLVDPDNRRPVDFDALAARLAGLAGAGIDELLPDWRSGGVKQFLVARGLALRGRHPRLFTHGGYQPLQVRGPRAAHAIAFLRSAGSDWAMTVVPRLTLPMLGQGAEIALPPANWGDTAIVLPPGLHGRHSRNAFTDDRLALRPELPIADLLGRCPVALLLGEG